MEEAILTVDQVAQILQVHPFTVLKFIKQGKLKAAKLGRVYRIRRSDVDKFLDEQASAGRVSEQKSRKKSVRKEHKPQDILPPASSFIDETSGAVSKEESKKVPEENPEEGKEGEDHYIINFTY